MKEFTTQWRKNNIQICYPTDRITRFFIRLFFKTWVELPAKNFSQTASFEFSSSLLESDLKDTLFTYSRELEGDRITTRFSNLKVFRSLLRSAYKGVNKKASVIGLPELYLALFRKAIFEPIEYFLSKRGWTLIHGSVFSYNNKTAVVSAGSKVGKSTLVRELMKTNGISVLSDNYCFLNGDRVLTVEEPFRAGSPSIQNISFYGRSVSGYPKMFEAKVDVFLFLERGQQNAIEPIKISEFILEVIQICDQAAEGAYYLNQKDILRLNKRNLSLDQQLPYYRLQAANGLDNIPEVKKMVLSLLK
jgi:hypothetical protein